MPGPQGYHVDSVTGALRKYHEPGAPCPTCDGASRSSTVGGGAPSPPATAIPYIEVGASSVDGATLGAAELALALLTDELGLPPTTTIRWFAPSRAGEDVAFEKPASHRGHVAGREPEAIWLRSDLDPDLALRVLSHEATHAKQWQDGLKGVRLPDDEAMEREAQSFEQSWISSWQRRDADGPLRRRMQALANGERVTARRPGESSLAGAGSSPLAAALRARREGR